MINKVILIGRLGQEAKRATMNSGKEVANFSIATKEYGKAKDGQKEERTEWHNCVAYDKPAEIISLYATKGSLVYVEGSLRTRQWTDQKGHERKTTEIVAHQVRLLDSRLPIAAKPEQQPQPAAQEIIDDEIPF